MRSAKELTLLADDNHSSDARQKNRPEIGKFKSPPSFVVMCCIAIVIFLGVGIWFIFDLQSSYFEIIKNQESLAVQASGLISQRFLNTLTAADYVLRDLTTNITVEELNSASTNQESQNRLSALVREKLDTLPNVYGLGFLDKQCIFVAAADRNVIGIKSNSKLNVQPGQVLERKTYVEYVPAAKSANKKPAILVSRPILSAEGEFDRTRRSAVDP